MSSKRRAHVVVEARRTSRHLRERAPTSFRRRAFFAQTDPATAKTRAHRHDRIYVAVGWVILFSPRPACTRALHADARCGNARVHSCLVLWGFDDASFARRASTCSASIRVHVGDAANVQAHASDRPEKNCDDLLTVEKTVIRFRGNRRPPQKRVSRATTPSRSTTRTSARNITRWMRASSPLRNHTHLIPTSATDVARAGLPFHRGDVVQSTTHPIESGPMRGARRRVCAGPTPACRLRTGPLYMQVH